MMIPKINSIWQFIANGPGKGDVQRVIASDVEEVVTVSEKMNTMIWSWLGPTAVFPSQFKFIRYENTN